MPDGLSQLPCHKLPHESAAYSGKRSPMTCHEHRFSYSGSKDTHTCMRWSVFLSILRSILVWNCWLFWSKPLKSRHALGTHQKHQQSDAEGVVSPAHRQPLRHLFV